MVCQAAPLPYALHTHQGNLVERWFGLLTEKQLRRGVQEQSRTGDSIYRTSPTKTFVWTKTADQILANVAHFCQRTLNTGLELFIVIVFAMRYPPG